MDYPVRQTPPTWAQIKTLISSAGVKDEDVVYGIDIGPFAHKVKVEKDEYGVEITDDLSGLFE